MKECQEVSKGNKLFLVIPCYNEESVLPISARKLQSVISSMMESGLISAESKIYFINDGSRDHTWNIVTELHKKDPMFCGISLSRNYGHQNALLAGMMELREQADAIISMDADLQDDVDVVPEMVRRFLSGAEIVYGVRASRETDPAYISWTAETFYKFMRFLGVDLVYNHADFRLLGKQALRALSEFHEVNLFLRGLIPLLGFQTACVFYRRKERAAGETKYPFYKRISLAIEGITSLSIKPIRCIMAIGLLSFAVSIFALLFALYAYYFRSDLVVAGWTSLFFSIWGIGGLMFLSVGLVGEYIGKIYLEVKGRPRYYVEKILR